MGEEETLLYFKMRKSLSGNIVMPKPSKIDRSSSWHFNLRRKDRKQLLSEMKGKRFSSVSTEIPQRIITEEITISEITLQKNYHAFRLYIFSCVRVTDLIVYFDYFTKDQSHMLSQLNKTGPVEATRKAFETIEEMVDKDDKFKRLLSALESAGYPKIVKIMKGQLIPVNDKHRKTIMQCASHIFERLNTADILPYLLRGHVINYTDAEEIQSAKSRGVGAIDLLFILPNRSRMWFPCFVKALRESRQTELADIIEQEKQKLEVPLESSLVVEEHNIGEKNHSDQDVNGDTCETRESLSIQIDIMEEPTESVVPATQDNLTCSICKQDHLDVAAEYFCRKCDQYFCCACDKAHSRITSSQRHTVVSGTNMPKRQRTEDTSAKCGCCVNRCVVM